MAKNNASILIRVTPAQKLVLEGFARAEGRSLSAYVRLRLKDSVCLNAKFGRPLCRVLKLTKKKMCPVCSGIIEDEMSRERKCRAQ